MTGVSYEREPAWEDGTDAEAQGAAQSVPVVLGRIMAELEVRLEYDADTYREDIARHTDKPLRGPLHQTINGILADLTERLQAIHPDLRPEHLQPPSYIDISQKQLVGSLKEGRSADYYGLYATKNLLMRPVANATMAADEHVVISGSRLTKPPYQSSELLKGCALGALAMIYNGITGEEAGEDHLRIAIRQSTGRELVHDDLLLSMLRSDTFRQTYGTVVNSRTFTGMTLDRLSRAIDGLASVPDRHIYLVANLLSKVSPASNATHRAIVTAVGPDTVTMHDPSSDTGGPDTTLPKREFARRWAGAYNAGYLVVAD